MMETPIPTPYTQDLDHAIACGLIPDQLAIPVELAPAIVAEIAALIPTT